jgi:transposase-like protein
MKHNTAAPDHKQLKERQLEKIQQALSEAETMDDFFGKEGIFARLFADTVEAMLEAEMTDHLGYERYEAKGRNSGNSRNGRYAAPLRTSTGDVTIQKPRDRQGTFQSQFVKKHERNSEEIEAKVLALYGKGMSTRDIQDLLADIYGVDVSAATISSITDKVWPLVEAWQNRPLAALYPVVFLDAMFIKMRRKQRVENVAVYTVLGVDLEGHKDVLGHWVGTGDGEGSNFWLSVLSDLQARGVEDIFIACIDGLKGFKEAIKAIFSRTEVQRCIVHQIRHSLKYVPWKDRKAFSSDLKTIYQAATREEAESNLVQLAETWNERYASAVRSWENNWEDLSTLFDYPCEIRRLIYTTNAIEAYHRQMRKVVKTKGSFPSPEATRKLLYLLNQQATKKWTMPMAYWPKILNQLAIRFEDRMPI